MSGCLAHSRGVVYVGQHETTARVELYDLGGRALPGGFRFRGAEGGRAEARHLSVDGDRRVWVADTPNDRVLAFHAVGRQAAVVTAGIAGPVAVAARGGSEDLELVVGLGGTRRGAVLRFGPELSSPRRLRSLGDPLAPFRRVADLALSGRDLYVLEAGARRVQVFRDGEHHWSIPLALPELPRCEPRALALAPGGRLVVAFAGERSLLALLDGSGDLLCALAEHGPEEGRVLAPGGVAVVPGLGDGDARVLVVDRDGARVQVFTLEGRCYGAFPAASA